MGCDFYTYYVLCIKCKDGRLIEDTLESTRERHWFYDDRKSYDSDFDDEAYDYNTYDAQMKQALQKYPRKDLYKDNNWLCTEYALDKYRGMFPALKVREDDILEVWKQGGAERRI
jgi:hypothetical protein